MRRSRSLRLRDALRGPTGLELKAANILPAILAGSAAGAAVTGLAIGASTLWFGVESASEAIVVMFLLPAFAFPFAAVGWLMGLTLIGGPAWFAAERLGLRGWLSAAIIGGAACGGAGASYSLAMGMGFGLTTFLAALGILVALLVRRIAYRLTKTPGRNEP